ncbi:MAG: cell division protein FtsK, partial [Sciscionella sp.]
MNTDEQFTNSPGDAPRAVVPAILDGELLEDTEDTNTASTTTRGSRVRAWWHRSGRVPLALKSRQHARQVVRDTVARLLCSPVWFLRATVRGIVASARLWRQWVRVHDYRDAAEAAEKLADKYTDIRTLTLFRWKVTGCVAGLAVLLALLGFVVYGPIALWSVGATASVALAIIGRRKDGAPGRKAVLAGPRSLTWTMDPQILVDAFRDAKLIGKDETLRLVQRTNRMGEGWA